MGRQVDEAVSRYRRLLLPPAPYYSVLMDGCLESGRDLSRGLKYNNFGIHGAGSASAADALAAVEGCVLRTSRRRRARTDRGDGREFRRPRRHAAQSLLEAPEGRQP